MEIVSQVSECFDELVKNSKKAAKEFIVKRLEILKPHLQTGDE